jgi:hypothetical protein
LLSGNWNGDTSPRPPYCGAYQIQYFTKNNDPISCENSTRWKRFFFHRNGYFITQINSDSMQDYVCRFDTSQQKLLLYDEKHTQVGQFKTKQTDNYREIILNGSLKQDSISLCAKRI